MMMKWQSLKKKRAMISIVVAIMLLIFASISTIVIVEISGRIRSLVETDDAVSRFEKDYARAAMLSVVKYFENSAHIDFATYSFAASQTVLGGQNEVIPVIVTSFIERDEPLIVSLSATTIHHPPLEAMIFQ